MGQSPAVFHAQQHRWTMFCTLTFAGPVPSPAYGFSLQRRWLDKVAQPILRQPATELEWLSREELGEQTGRMHYHVLIGEIRDASRVKPKTCLALMDQWEQVTKKALGQAGMARVRIFQPNMQGVDYVLKGLENVTEWTLRGANCYEIGKFGGELGRTVRLARALVVSWTEQKGNKYAQHARDGRDARRVKCEL